MEDIKYKYNTMEINSLFDFAKIKGGFNNNCKNVYFIALQGASQTLRQDIEYADKMLSLEMDRHKLIYKRITTLPKLSLQEDIDYYLSCYDKWNNPDINSLEIKITGNNKNLAEMLCQALKETISAYIKDKKETSGTIKKNLAIKLMYWADMLFYKDCFNRTDKDCIKIIAQNICKDAECYFYYMLTMSGMDVLLLQTNKDMEFPESIKEKVKRVVLGDYAEWEIPAPYITEKIPVHIPEKVNRRNKAENHNIIADIAENKKNITLVPEISAISRKEEKSFEQLALLASSVVMIAIHDKTGKIIGSGSGIMIGKDGYILTNYHVICDGAFFSIRIEEDDNIYNTNEIIKYNYNIDLAITRIQRKLSPIPVYNGREKLVRGQRIIAIGSPLGLFNSVSDGIISGFRKIENNVDVLQFTAPVSPGSSGGAILNMYGEVIGISSAIIDSGQNINLAIQYSDINRFIHGFI